MAKIKEFQESPEEGREVYSTELGLTQLGGELSDGEEIFTEGVNDDAD